MNGLTRDVAQTGLLIGLVLIWVVLALTRCSMDGTDRYGQPNQPGYAVPVSEDRN